MSYWYQYATTANRLNRSYFTGFVDISGGDLTLRNSNFNMNGIIAQNTGNVAAFQTTSYSYISWNDVSSNFLSTQNSGTVNGSLFITGDVSMNGNLYTRTNNSVSLVSYSVAQDMSLNGRFYVSGDASLGGKLYVLSDVSLSNRLFVKGDASLNGNVSINGNLVLHNGLNVTIGQQITNTITIAPPIAQFYTINIPSSASITITLPNPGSDYAGTGITFKRIQNINTTIVFTTVSAASVMYAYNSVTLSTSTTLPANSLYHTIFICDGTYWHQLSTT
jgi:hypothetical protein